MSVTTTGVTLTHRYLMGKTKDELATLVLYYADENQRLHDEKCLAELRLHEAEVDALDDLWGIYRAMLSYGSDWSAWPRIERAINHFNHERMMREGRACVEAFKGTL